MRGLPSSSRRFVPSIVVSVFLFLAVHSYYYRQPTLTNPPSWTQLKDMERHLPQHDLSLPFPEGSTGRYVKFSIQSQQLGWNNILGELLMNAHLAYVSRRGYVFPYYVWEPRHYPFSRSPEREWPPHTPLNALISGPAAGGSWESNDDTPRSISSDWFDVVCPPSKRHIIESADIKASRSVKQADVMLREYAAIIRDTPEQCVEIVESPGDHIPQLFDMWLWGDPRLLSVWESYSKSPTSRLLGTSPIVRSAVERNSYLFLPRGFRPFIKVGTSPYDRVLVMHLRRGDFAHACENFALYESQFNGWNQLEFLPDRLIIPHNETQKLEVYRRRCSPDFLEIVAKAREVQAQYHHLDTVYLSTNEKGEWLDRVIGALKKEGWASVMSSHDLRFRTAEEVEVSMAIDMEIARLAAVFVGNGWSSFSSNIVHRRLVDEKAPMSIRFY